jgi:hypothetical protein
LYSACHKAALVPLSVAKSYRPRPSERPNSRRGNTDRGPSLATTFSSVWQLQEISLPPVLVHPRSTQKPKRRAEFRGGPTYRTGYLA